LWLGGFIGFALHFVIHIAQSVLIRKYIPALLTSIICLPVSVWIIGKCLMQISDSAFEAVVCMLAGIVIVAVNLKFAQKLIGWFTRKMGITPLV